MGTYQILVEQLELDLAKITPEIERIAELLIETDGESSRPPIVEASGINPIEAYEMYKLVGDSEIAIAAKLAESKGLERLTVLIANDQLAEMENLLNAKVTEIATPKPKVTRTATPKTEKIVEPKKVTKIATPKPVAPKKVTKIATPTYRELQKILKKLKIEGKTTIKLNSKKEILVAEWKKLQ